MKAVLFVLCFVFAITMAKVVQLTPDNFDEVVDGSKSVFVKFYAPWCGHCKRVAPTWEELSEVFAKSQDVVIAEVECDEHKSLATRFGIRGFPTLKIFPKSGEPEDYSGARELDDFITFVNKKAGTRVRASAPVSATTVLTTSTFEEVVMDEDKCAFVKFYAPWCGHCKKLAPTYEKLANVFKSESNVVIGEVECDEHKEVATSQGITGFPTMKLYVPGQKEEPIKYQNARELDELVEFVNEHCGTQRLTSGKLSPEAGRVESLDALAKEFAAASMDEYDGIMKRCNAEADNEHIMYCKLMKFLKRKGGVSVVQSEIDRLNRMVDSDAIKAEKVDEFVKRINILNAFLA